MLYDFLDKFVLFLFIVLFKYMIMFLKNNTLIEQGYKLWIGIMQEKNNKRKMSGKLVIISLEDDSII